MGGYDGSDYSDISWVIDLKSMSEGRDDGWETRSWGSTKARRFDHGCWQLSNTNWRYFFGLLF